MINFTVVKTIKNSWDKKKFTEELGQLLDKPLIGKIWDWIAERLKKEGETENHKSENGKSEPKA